VIADLMRQLRVVPSEFLAVARRGHPGCNAGLTAPLCQEEANGWRENAICGESGQWHGGIAPCLVRIVRFGVRPPSPSSPWAAGQQSGGARANHGNRLRIRVDQDRRDHIGHAGENPLSAGLSRRRKGREVRERGHWKKSKGFGRRDSQ
jgi:hypothetical protein